MALPSSPTFLQQLFKGYLSHAGAHEMDWHEAIQRGQLLRDVRNQNPGLGQLQLNLEQFQHKDAPWYVGTIGDYFPNLTYTKRGDYLGNINLISNEPGRGIFYREPSGRGEAGAIFLDPTAGSFEGLMHGLSPEYDLALNLAHEVIHAAQFAKKGAYAFPDRAYIAPSLADRLGVARMLPGGVDAMWARGEISPRESAIINIPQKRDIPYMRQPHEIAARKGSGPIAKALLENRPGPLLGIAAVPGLLDMLSHWSRTEGTNPASEFARGAVNTLSPSGGIPSAQDALDAYNSIADPTSPSGQRGGTALGKFGLEQIMGIAQLLQTNPNELIKHIIQSVARNPAYGAGSGLAMALPSPGEFLKMAKGEALSASEKLAQQHVADWNLRQYEGPLGPAYRGTPEERLLRAVNGEPDVTPEVWTREERGGEMLRNAGVEGPQSYHDLPDQILSQQADVMTRWAKEAEAHPDPKVRARVGPKYRGEAAIANAEILRREFPNAPLGQRMFRNGDEWVNTSRGWTLNPDAPKPKGPHAPPNLIAQVARVVRDKGAAWGVEEAIRHGGMDPRNASNLVAATLAQWSASKVRLTPEQNAWLELYRAGKYKP